jgi:hypothetical protein
MQYCRLGASRRANLVQDGGNGVDTAPAKVKPALLFLAGAPGAGKTTFYETKPQAGFPTVLKASTSPLEQARVEGERVRLLKERRSFVYVGSTVDLDLLRTARSSELKAKVMFISTEHPDLNTARVLARVSRGGPFAPLVTPDVGIDFFEHSKLFPSEAFGAVPACGNEATLTLSLPLNPPAAEENLTL